MSSEIFKNNQDAILFGNSGNVFKKPYDFGSGIHNTDEYSFWIRDLNKPTSEDFTLLFWVNLLEPSNTGYFTFYDENDDKKINGVGQAGIRFYLQESFVNTEIQSHMNATTVGKHHLLGVTKKGNSYRIIYQNKSTEAAMYDADFTTLKDLQLGIGYRYIIQNLVKNRLSECLMFDRVLSQNEINFFYQNGSGNELMSTLGLRFRIPLNKAEILTINSEEKVGIKDTSGNNHHVTIEGLPAGDLQEQLDYSNTNLFVPFFQ